MNEQPVMPLFAPMYTIGSELANLNWLTVCYETDSERLNQILPGPLEPGERAEVLIWVAEFISATFEGPSGLRQLPRYFQGGVAVRAHLAGEEVAYPLVSYITGLNHGFTGRELFGLPKKQAREVTLSDRNGRVDASITTAEGTRLIDISGQAAAPAADAAIVPDWFSRQRTVKLIPSATGTGYDVKQLVAVPFGFSNTTDVHEVNVELAIASTPLDPLADLPVKSLSYHRIGKTNLSVGYGSYLGEPTSLPNWGKP